MLSRCANDQCGKPFLRLRDGKLFLVETERLTKPGQSVSPPFVRARQPQRQVEHYWLCDDCAKKWTLVYEREHGVALAPLRRPVATVRPDCGSGTWRHRLRARRLTHRHAFSSLSGLLDRVQHAFGRRVKPPLFLFLDVVLG
jgi:hypothetical protein